MRLFLTILVFTIWPWITNASNAGFVQGIWYDPDPFFVGDNVRIYAAVRNNTGSDLTGKVSFLVDGKVIGEASVRALNGRLVESWTDWEATAGTNTMEVLLTQTELSNINDGPKSVTVTSPSASEIRFIDGDNDNDKVGDNKDTDDDNDGVSDQDEIENGTDPLLFNNQTQSPIAPPSNSISTTTENKGLERFIDNDQAYDLVNNVTDVINKITDGLKQHKGGIWTLDTTTTQTLGADQITEKGTDEQKWVSVLKSIYKALLTVIIFILSYPAILELLILLALLYGFYRLVRYYGKRRRG